jgi:exodeoxyribonuclease V alpha subunit
MGVKDVRSHVLKRVADTSKAETPTARKSYEIVANMLRVLPRAVRDLLFDRLCLFELSPDQVRLITGNGLARDADRLAVGLLSTAEAIADNPFLIVEEYDPMDRDERIPFYRIDQGVYLPKSTGGLKVPGLDEFDNDDKRRLRAVAVSILRAAIADGHSFLPQDDLLAAISRKRLVGMPASIGAAVLARDLPFYEETLSLVDGGNFKGWMLKVMAIDEDVIRMRIKKLQGRKPNAVAVEDWARHLPKGAGLPPKVQREAIRTQREALERLSTQPFSVLIGSAGTGKTTVVAALINGLRQADPTEKFLLLAPTGKAAVRMRRKINDIAGIDLEPLTIHGYLVRNSWMDGETFRCLREGQPIEADVSTVIIDECSMLETPMLATIIRSIDWTSKRLKRLILAGDPQQLPPIGTGAPFKNIVDHLAASNTAAHRPCTLTVNCRQIQEDSSALRLAEQFTAKADRVTADELFQEMATGGRVGIDLEVRFFNNETDLPDCVTQLVEDAVNELLKLNDIKQGFDPDRPWEAYDSLHGLDGNVGDWQLDAFEVLSPYRGGYFGSDQLNRHLQELLRGRLFSGKYTAKLGQPGGRQFIGADKVLQVQNKRIRAKTRIAWDGNKNVDFYLANGELGRMMKVGKKGKEKFGWARFETDPRVTISIDGGWAREALDLGYAMSVHKSQGSDFGGVIVAVPKEERVQLVTRELLYTALTRFTRRMYLLVQGQPGDLDAIRIGLWRGASCFLRRHTCLYTAQRAIADIDDWRPEKRIIRTLRGELVASKSEALIATLLENAKVPYFYEKLLIANDGTIRRPDFTIPIETPDGPKELYWEHWGKLGDPTYEASVVRRREWYRRQGLTDHLVETDELGGFDAKKIQRLIEEHILP